MLQVQTSPSASRGLSSALSHLDEFQDIWLHLGFTQLGPWQHSVMRVAPASAPHGEPPPDQERCYVAFAGAVSNLHKALLAVADCPDIAVRFYTIEESGRPIPSVVPNIAPVIACPDCSEPNPVEGTGSKAKKGGAPGGTGTESDGSIDHEDPKASSGAEEGEVECDIGPPEEPVGALVLALEDTYAELPPEVSFGGASSSGGPAGPADPPVVAPPRSVPEAG